MNTHNAPHKMRTPAGEAGVQQIKKQLATELNIGVFKQRVKRWLLRWARTITSEVGMPSSRWTDRCQAKLDAMEEGGSR